MTTKHHGEKKRKEKKRTHCTMFPYHRKREHRQIMTKEKPRF
jgi:hypothetical protein